MPALLLERYGAGSTPAPVEQLSLSVVVALVLQKLAEKVIGAENKRIEKWRAAWLFAVCHYLVWHACYLIYLEDVSIYTRRQSSSSSIFGVRPNETFPSTAGGPSCLGPFGTCGC